MASPVEIRLLGPLEILHGSRTAAPRAPKQRALLADLVARRGDVVPPDVLVDDLWGAQPPATARHALQVYVSELRRTLPEGVLATHPAGYRLEVAPAQVDAAQFEHLLGEARAALAGDEAERAAGLLRDALALWRGRAYADFAYEPWAQVEIHRLEELRQEALELRINADLALGRADLVAELEALVQESPLRERLRMQLMLALYRAGRQADALEQFRLARETLVEELGIEPGPELRELQAAILRQDAALLHPSAPAPRRKLASILFADVVDSTPLATALDPEAVAAVLRRYFDVAATAIVRHGGTVEKFVGDAVMAVFGAPVAHEDDALRAVRAAVEIRDGAAALDESLERELGVRLPVRIGIASGEVLAGAATPTGPLATGAPVNIAARLQQVADPGGIAVDALTRQLSAGACAYAPLGELDLRGIATPVTAFRLQALLPAAPALARRLDAPLIGRERELAALEREYRKAAARRSLRAVTLLGAPGIGKSRLAHEFAGRLAADEAEVRFARCLPYGDAPAFRPLREALGSREEVRAALRGDEDAEEIAVRLDAVLGSETTTPVDEVPWAFRRFCEALARARPLVLVLDDLHWAAPPLLDLVEHLATRSSGAPVLLLCVARDELGGERTLAGDRILVEPLSVDETDSLANHLAADGLDDEMRARLVAAAEGNPLFVEQLLAHAAETGSIDPPPTLRALLAARLDRLGPGERAVLDGAAVVGRDFANADVADLLGADAAPTAVRHLHALEERGFVRVRDQRARFRHALIHDAAYRAVPKELRAELHERYADVLARRAAEDELIGYHLERAHGLLAELCRADRRTHRLAEDAGLRLGSAGIRALRGGDAAAGAQLLRRSTRLLPAEHALRRQLLCELGVALGTAGDAAGASRVLAEARAEASAAGDRRIELRAEIELGVRKVLTDTEGSAAAFLALAADAIPILSGVEDDRALGRVWMLAAWVHGGVHGRNALRRDAAERALVHYRRSGWPSSACLSQLAAALYFGPTRATEAIDRLRALLGEVEDFAGEANVRAYLGGLYAMRGRWGDALAALAEARRLFEELGQTSEVARVCDAVTGEVLLFADDAAGAEHVLRGACAVLERMRDRNLLATQAAVLAEALYRQGRYDEAAQWVAVARDNAASDDVDARAALSSVHGKLRARAGAVAEGEASVREAIRLADATDAVNNQARAYLDLAEVLSLRSGDATTATGEAVRRFELKGNAAGIALAQRVLAAPTPA